MPPQFLVVGHVVRDLVEGGWRLGGAASYASLLARNLGLDAAIVTSAAADVPLDELLPGIERRVIPSERTTQMRNVYEGGQRRQWLPARGSRLRAEHVPEEWRGTPIVLLGPVAGEVDAGVAECFEQSLVGVGAQGWLRDAAEDTGVVRIPPSRWDAEPVLRHARAVFFSDEDVPADEVPGALERWASMVEIVAFTRGHDGADVGVRGEWRHAQAFPARTVDPTGAGDVFAAAFLIRLHETDDPWESARFASAASSFAVESEGAAGLPDRARIEARMREHPGVGVERSA